MQLGLFELKIGICFGIQSSLAGGAGVRLRISREKSFKADLIHGETI